MSTVSLVLNDDPEWAATMAYQAMLRAGRALLFAHGYLPADGGQHRTVVEVTGKITGKECRSIIAQFEKLRRKRNTFFYESLDSSNKTEAKQAIQTATKLVSVIKDIIDYLDPQQQMNLV